MHACAHTCVHTCLCAGEHAQMAVNLHKCVCEHVCACECVATVHCQLNDAAKAKLRIT